MAIEDYMGDEGVWHRARWNDYIQARNSTHEKWYDNSAALYGDPFSVWDDVFERYLDSLHDYRRDRVLFNINKCRTILAARDSFVTGDNAAIYVHSNSDETISRQQANLAQRVARAYWAEHDMWAKFLDAREYCKWGGNAYLRIYYNPSMGRRVKGTPFREGQVLVQVLSPFQVAWDPLADAWDKVEHVYVASIKPIEEVMKQYPGVDWTETLKDNEKTAWVSQHERYIQAQKPELSNVHNLRDEKGRPRNILQLEYFEKPTPSNPQGKYQVIFGQKVIKTKPLEIGQLPIEWFYDMKVAGTCLAQTPLTEMVPLQEAVDRLASLCLERAQLPDIYSFPDSLGWPDNPRKFAGKAFVIGTHRSYTGGASSVPTIVQSGQIRQDYIALFRMYEEQMENIAGVSSISSRARPPYQMSGRMGYIVTDANKALLQKISYGFKKSCERTMRLVLAYINKYYTEERTASFINEADRSEVVNYRGTDIGTDYTLDISLGQNLMDDPTTIAQMTLQLLSIPLVAQQIMSNPVATKKAVELINPELSQKIFSEQDAAVAEDENLKIKQGDTPKVEPWHVHAAHKREHKRALDSDDFTTWPEVAQRYLIMHYEQHEDMEQAEFNRMAWRNAMLNMGQAQMGGGRASGGTRPQGSPGVAPPQSQSQSIDTRLERLTQGEFPNAPKPGGES